jgi:hypothetical protein
MNFYGWWEKWLIEGDGACLDLVHPYAYSLAESAWNAALANQWQPIETAPKDKKIWLWWPEIDEYPVVGEWHKLGFWMVSRLGAGRVGSDPIHWMPQPEPPKEKK